MIWHSRSNQGVPDLPNLRQHMHQNGPKRRLEPFWLDAGLDPLTKGDKPILEKDSRKIQYLPNEGDQNR